MDISNHDSAVLVAAYTRSEAGKKAYRDEWITIAREMARIRREFPDNQTFSIYLASIGVEYSTHDRAAFVWLGGITDDDIISAMDRNPTASPRLLRAYMEEKGYTDPVECLQNVNTTSRPTDTSETTESSPSESNAGGSKPAETSSPKETNPLVQRVGPHLGTILFDTYRNRYTRTMLVKQSKTNLRKFAKTVEAAREAGILSVNNADIREKPSLRLIDADMKPNLAKCYGKLPRVTDRLQEMLKAHSNPEPESEPASEPTSTKETSTERKSSNVTQMPQQVVYYGARLWPVSEHSGPGYTQEKAEAAFHHVQDMERYLINQHGETPGNASAFLMRQAMWIRKFDPASGELYHRAATALRKRGQPDAPCIVPPLPTRFAGK